ncbi:hypothetical protein MTR67_028323 [Solanum verrucosum]|uniref:Reverse transcriptase zinc-binding domain-containing protein n=1 Tax=Solanum verrucosum TaxID=315347 RepID=A0AAF0R6F5_SOLVR|nr:hypothetical protein MTR67_028323 [Solanum verrucosum]
MVLFEGVTGLHINWRKSLIYPPINVVNNVSWLATILGVEVGTLPATYLGLPLGAKSMSIDIWNNVIEKCEKKLARWKTQYLSMGGRLTLINSVLDALPTYMMTLFPIPLGVTKRLDSIRRKFLWQGNKEKKGFHLVKWKSVITGKKNGGLGIKNLNLQSKALQMKWLWKYANGNQLLWERVIEAKYIPEDKWMTKEVTTPYGVNLWRSIRNLWDEVKNNSKQGFIADLWTLQGWNFNFRRHLNDWEVQRVADFLNTVEPFNGLQTGNDVLWWTGNNGGVYKLANEAALTQDNVMKRGITLCSRCLLCGETLENVNHLFLRCKYTQQLWRIFLSHKGISWTMPGKVSEALKSWEEAGVLAKDRGRWRLIPASIWWAIWKERNSRCFENIENSVQKVKLNCILLLCF